MCEYALACNCVYAPRAIYNIALLQYASGRQTDAVSGITLSQHLCMFKTQRAALNHEAADTHTLISTSAPKGGESHCHAISLMHVGIKICLQLIIQKRHRNFRISWLSIDAKCNRKRQPQNHPPSSVQQFKSNVEWDDNMFCF